MTAGGDSSSTSEFSWNDIKKALWQLNRETDSYLILEQRSPENSEQYWFIQCAVALQGLDAAAYFSDAYHHRSLDVSGFGESEV